VSTQLPWLLGTFPGDKLAGMRLAVYMLILRRHPFCCHDMMHNKPFRDDASAVLTHSFYCTVNVFLSVTITSQLMLCRAKVAICSEINAIHVNTAWAECRIFEC
jgi:hypothetical protein